MSTLDEVLSSDIIYSVRSDGSVVIATFVPLDGVEREEARWDLRVTDKQGRSLKDELLTVKGSLDSSMYRKLYSLDELKELAQDRDYTEWHEGYPPQPGSHLSASSSENASSPATQAPLKETGSPSEAERKRETERIIQQSLNELAKARPGDIQQITVAQLNIDREYCQEALQQGQKSFQLAAKFAPWGIVFIAISSLLLMLLTFFVGKGDIQAWVALVNIFNSLLIEGIPGVGFYMYAQASKQFGVFSERLDRRNRYLIANGIISTSLDGAEQKQAFLTLIQHILSSTEPDIDSLIARTAAAKTTSAPNP